MHGILPIFKPAGVLSKDVSRVLQKRFGVKHLGHVGTLDPFAEGVLPILIGRATRLQDFYLDLPKIYRCRLAFGYATDSCDSDGQTIATAEKPSDLSVNQLQKVCELFVGDIVQEAPLHSAIQFQGVRAHEYARSQKEVPEELKNRLIRKVRIDQITALSASRDEAVLRVTCGKGTYIRSLGRDIAARLGTCGTLTSLVRESSAGITMDRCISAANFEDPQFEPSAHLWPVESVDIGLPWIQFDDSVLKTALFHGKDIEVSQKQCERYSPENEVILVVEKHRWLALVTVLSRDDSKRTLTVRMKRNLS